MNILRITIELLLNNKGLFHLKLITINFFYSAYCLVLSA
jgi:hypothetical protein